MRRRKWSALSAGPVSVGSRRLLGEDQVEIRGAEPIWNLVPQDPEPSVPKWVIAGFQHLTNLRHDVICRKGDVYTAPVLNTPVGDLSVNVGDPIVFHGPILPIRQPHGAFSDHLQTARMPE